MTEPVFPRPLLMSIYHGITQYQYRGIACWKDPFDLAIMARLLWDAKPRTIIEIGTNDGGSALWFADQLKSFGIDGMVHSVDINPIAHVRQDNVKFYKGDVRNLADTFPAEWIAQQPRPILVNEDSVHDAETSLAALRWFASFAAVGEYIIIEDGCTNEVIPGGHPCGGPLVAIKTFIDEQGGKYAINHHYCNMFGESVTFSPNGYILRQS